MENKFLHINIDEITLTVLPKKKIYIENWNKYANGIIFRFIKSSKVDVVFNGQLQEMVSGRLQGYSRSYNLGAKDYYFAMAYNENHPTMGVCIRFSARAWAVYQSKYKKLYKREIILSDFLQMVNSSCDEIVRMSRVDMTVDYFNYDINISELCKRLQDGTIIVQDDKGRKRIQNIDFIGKNNKIGTIYVGSRKANTRTFLRIYDKRDEQLCMNGYRKKEALDCASWIRFEAVYKGKYAHIISNTLLTNKMTAEGFEKYIAQIITQKYRFFDVDKEEYIECTKKILEVSNGSNMPVLYCPSLRDNELKRNIEHIKYGSGLYSTLYKIGQLYGEEAINEFWIYLMECYKKEKWMSKAMYKEISLWLKKHEELREGRLSDNY